MFCRQCGTQLNPDTRFCSHCGHPVSKDNLSQKQPDKKKAMPSWFKLLLSLVVIGLILLGSRSWFEEDTAHSVKGQVEALRSNKITEAYYSFTSKDFQKATSLDTFKEFIKAYPVFSLNESLSIDERSAEDETETVNSTLISKNGEKAQVQYKLIKEGDKWKILSIKLIEPATPNVAVNSSILNELIFPVQEQLKALRSLNFSKAYEYVSKDFTLDTPLEKFEAFMKSYPILSNFHKIEYENHSIHDDQGDVTVVLQSPEGPIPAEYKLIKEDGKWKIWGLKLYLLANQSFTQQTASTAPIEKAVQEQIDSLTAGDINKAYDEFGSKEFKEVTSFEAFKDFILRNPILSKHGSIDFTQSDIINGKGKLKADFQADKQSLTVEYTLGMEDGKWKIWGMQVLQNADTLPDKNVQNDQETDSLSQIFRKVIHEQLNAIRTNDLIKAYHDYTSEGFQKTTSLKEFIEFIKNQPGLSDNESSHLSKLSFNNNIGILTGTLKSKASLVYPIEYELVKEDERWKILHISIQPSQQNLPSSKD